MPCTCNPQHDQEEVKMTALNQKTIKRLIKKFGPKIDLESDTGVLEELLREISADFGTPIHNLSATNPTLVITVPKPVAGYDKTYERGYQRDNYDKLYQQYDKTYPNIPRQPRPHA
jgi:hypothetical protein